MSNVETSMLTRSTDNTATQQGSIFFVGTATTIIQYGGFAILTDPNFLHAGDHVHLGYGLTSQRRTNPALEIEDLPPLDLCLLSHMHEDHWDRVAAAKLSKTLPIVTTYEAAKKLRQQGFTQPYPLETWTPQIFRKGEQWLRITAMPARHGPGALQALLPSVNGSMLEWGETDQPSRFRLYISGDTILHDDLRRIPQQYPNIDLALLHLGGTRVFGMLLTMDAQQGVQAIRLIRPHKVIPIHYNDYTVFKSPIADFLQAVDDAHLGVPIHYLGHGDTYTFETAE